MSIIRGRRPTQNYYQISNEILNDPSLSAEALGMLVYLLSKPDDWQVMPSHLQNRFGCGKDKIYRVLGDLQKAGYATIEQERNAAGSFVKNGYIITEKSPLPENPEVAGNPVPAEPLPGYPLPGNPPLLKKESTNNRFIQKTDETDSPTLSLGGEREVFEAELITPREQAERFFDKQFWPAYPKRFGSNPKEPARKKIVTAILRGEKPEEILAGVNRLFSMLQRGGKLGTEYVPMALTWINRKSWKDDPVPEGNGKARGEMSFWDAAMAMESDNGSGAN